MVQEQTLPGTKASAIVASTSLAGVYSTTRMNGVHRTLTRNERIQGAAFYTAIAVLSTRLAWYSTFLLYLVQERPPECRIP